MHEAHGCSGRLTTASPSCGGRVACDSADREASMRAETVFHATNFRCPANPSPERVFLAPPI